MTTQKKSQRAMASAKKSTSKAKVEIKIEPVALDHRDKTAFMVVMLSRPEGASLKEMAEALGWKKTRYAVQCQLMLKRPVELSPPKRKLTSGPTTLKPTLKLPSNRKGADYRPLNYFV